MCAMCRKALVFVHSPEEIHLGDQGNDDARCCNMFSAMVSAGCSSIKTYPNTLSKNMHVTTKLSSGSRVTSTSAVFDIYRVDAKCELTHEGRLDLDEAKTEVGLPTNTPLYLEFIFSNSNYLARHSSSPAMVYCSRHGRVIAIRPRCSTSMGSMTPPSGKPAVDLVDQVQLSDCKARS